MKLRSVRQLIQKNRTCRRFHQHIRIRISDLRRLVDLARFSASGANLQPLKYLLANRPRDCAAIFPYLAWAGYLTDWPGPAEGEHPAAYIVILGDTSISRQFGCDQGIAAQSMTLGATEMGLGGCIIGSIQRNRLRKVLAIPNRYEILLVLALGKPAESVILEQARNGHIRYWRDRQGRHHVPKRPLNELIISTRHGI